MQSMSRQYLNNIQEIHFCTNSKLDDKFINTIIMLSENEKRIPQKREETNIKFEGK